MSKIQIIIKCLGLEATLLRAYERPNRLANHLWGQPVLSEHQRIYRPQQKRNWCCLNIFQFLFSESHSAFVEESQSYRFPKHVRISMISSSRSWSLPTLLFLCPLLCYGKFWFWSNFSGATLLLVCVSPSLLLICPHLPLFSSSSSLHSYNFAFSFLG